jgi:hypothetical protein
MMYVESDVCNWNRSLASDPANNSAAFVDGVCGLIGQKDRAVEAGRGPQVHCHSKTVGHLLNDAKNVWVSICHPVGVSHFEERELA